MRAWADGVMHREEGVTDVPPEAIEASLNLIVYYQAMVAERRKARGLKLNYPEAVARLLPDLAAALRDEPDEYTRGALREAVACRTSAAPDRGLNIE